MSALRLGDSDGVGLMSVLQLRYRLWYRIGYCAAAGILLVVLDDL